MQIGATPLPVAIKEHPDPFWTYWIPGLGLLFGFLAVVFSGWALKRIGDQIKIANEQTKIANESLTLTRESIELAKKDFAATTEALGITKGQAQKADAEREAAPDLNLSMALGLGTDGIKANTPTTLSFLVTNKGRVAEDALVFVAFPGEWETEREWKERTNTKRGVMTFAARANLPYDPKDRDMSIRRPVEGLNIELRTIQFPLHERVVAGVPVRAFYTTIAAPTGKYEIYWKIASEKWHFPDEKEFGVIEVTVE
jgi:hypothetical protein